MITVVPTVVFPVQQLFFLNTAFKIFSIFGYCTQWAHVYLSAFTWYYPALTKTNKSICLKRRNLSINLKKKIYKIWKSLYLLNAYRTFLQSDFGALSFSFSPHSAFLIFGLRLKTKKSYRPRSIKAFLLNNPYFFSYNSIIDDSWYYLVGGLISPFSWDYTTKFSYFQISPVYELEEVATAPSDSEELTTRYKLILNNYFYDVSSMLDYSNLPFGAVINLETTGEDQSDISAPSPYLFLNNSAINKSNFVYHSSTVLELFDEYSSFFFDLKSALVDSTGTLNADALFVTFYQMFWDYETLSHVFFELNNYDAIDTYRDYRHARVFFFKPHSIRRSFFSSFFSKFLFYLDSRYLPFKVRPIRRLLNATLLYSHPASAVGALLQSFFVSQNFYRYNSFLLNDNIFILNLKIIRELFKFYSSYLRDNNHTQINSNNLILKKHQLLINFYNFKNIRIGSKKFIDFIENNCFLHSNHISSSDVDLHFFENNPSFVDLCDSDPDIINVIRDDLLQQPIFFTKELVPFASEWDGFAFLNDSFIDDLPSEFIYNFKKMSYSFISKNELHRYLLTKYSKTVKLQYHNGLDSEVFDDSIEDFNSNLFHHTAPKWSFFNTKPSHLSYLIKSGWSDKRGLFLKNQIGFWEQMDDGVGELAIKRIRFKPGYSTQWRNARTALKLVLGLKFRYQHRLTTYLSRFTKFNRFRLILHFEMQLWNILLKSRFAYDNATLETILQSNAVYLNGVTCSNRYLQTFTGDLIQLIISFKYYIVHRWFLNWSLKRRIKMKKIASFKSFSESETEDKQRSVRLPNWILENEGINDDTLKYVEIDYFTLSLMIIYEPFTWADLNPYSLIKLRPTTMRLYNWKYIT